MIFHPAILALLVGSLVISGMLAYSAAYGVTILRKWDLKSGSELQLQLERRTYLISTVMSYALGFQLLSLFLFVYTADHLASLFVGAMCAAGSLKVNGWGYPTIIIKIVNFLLAGLWLIVNFADNRAHDYPLIKRKYGLLLLLAPFILAELIIQGGYFLGLEPDIITSCCGALFTSDTQGLTSGIVALPLVPVEAAFFAIMAATLTAGAVFYWKGRGAYVFAVLSLFAFIISIIAIISFISLYFYELPTHHCPFCILQRDYSHVGYALYLTFLCGAVAGLGVGVLMPFRRIESLRQALPRIQRRLALFSMAAYATFIAISGYGMVFSNLKLTGY